MKENKKSSEAHHLTFIFQGRYLPPSALAVINISSGGNKLPLFVFHLAGNVEAF